MPTPAAVMKRRLRAFEARAVELRQQIAVLQEEADQVEGEIARWRIGSEIWDEVEQELRGDAGEPGTPCGPSADGDASGAGEPENGSNTAASRYVPRREEGSDPGRLPGLYSTIVEFVRGVQEPVRVREVAEALFGEKAGRSRQEGVRCQLKRLVERGWLASADGRAFTVVS